MLRSLCRPDPAGGARDGQMAGAEIDPKSDVWRQASYCAWSLVYLEQKCHIAIRERVLASSSASINPVAWPERIPGQTQPFRVV